MKQPEETIGRRSRRRPGSADASHAVFDRTRPYRHLRNPFEPMKVFSDDQVAAIHEAALVMLETQGMKVLSEDARVLYRNAGAEVDEATLMCASTANSSPHRWRARRATSPCTRSIRRAMFPCRINASPSRRRPDRRTSWTRRAAGVAGTLEDFCNIVKLCQNFEVIHVLGGATEPQDIPVHIRHLEVTRAQLMLCDKIPFHFFARAQAGRR